MDGLDSFISCKGKKGRGIKVCVSSSNLTVITDLGTFERISRHVASLNRTVLVVSRFRDLRPPVTQILYQFESLVSEIPMDSRSPPRVLHGWMAQIYFGTFIVKFPDLSSSGLPESRSPKSRYQLLFRDFRLCSRGLNPHASPDRSNGCRVF
jgi:hypothetical protein